MSISSRIATGTRHTRKRTVVRGAGSAVARIAELVSSGAGVLAVCADAGRRAELAAGATGLARFNGGAGRIACSRCEAAALAEVAAKGPGGFGLVDYPTVERAAEIEADGLVGCFEHVVLVDPPHSDAAALLASWPRAAEFDRGGDGQAGFLHIAWTDAEREFSLAVHDEQSASRRAVAGIFRSLREVGGATGGELRKALEGAGSQAHSPETAARCFRVLAELDLVAGEPAQGAGAVGVVSSEGTELERSAAFQAYRRDHSEAAQYLARLPQP